MVSAKRVLIMPNVAVMMGVKSFLNPCAMYPLVFAPVLVPQTLTVLLEATVKQMERVLPVRLTLIAAP